MTATHCLPLCWLSPVPSTYSLWQRRVCSTLYCLYLQILTPADVEQGNDLCCFPAIMGTGTAFSFIFFHLLLKTSYKIFWEVHKFVHRLLSNLWLCLVTQLHSCWNALGRCAAFNTSWAGRASSSAMKIICASEPVLDWINILQLILHKEKPAGQ